MEEVHFLIEGCKLISHHAKLWAVELVSFGQCFIIAPIISIRFRVRTIISWNCSFAAFASNFRSYVPCSFQAKDLQSVSISIPLMSDRRLSLKIKKYIIEIITIVPQQWPEAKQVSEMILLVSFFSFESRIIAPPAADLSPIATSVLILNFSVGGCSHFRTLASLIWSLGVIPASIRAFELHTILVLSYTNLWYQLWYVSGYPLDSIVCPPEKFCYTPSTRSIGWSPEQ